MLHDTQKKISHFLLSLCIMVLTAMHLPLYADLTWAEKNDPIPMFTTLNLDDSLLLTRKQLEYKFDESGGRDYEWADKKRNCINISISPFAQSADRGKTIKGSRCTNNPDPIPNPLRCTERFETPLGDLTGRTSMIALLYGNRPASSNGLLPGGATGALSIALNKLFDLTPTQIVNPQTDEIEIDPDQLFGFFSFPMKYRKRGLRMEASGLLPRGFGLQLQTGFSTIRQVSEDILNLTNPDEEIGGISGTDVDTYLMDELRTIVGDIGIGFCEDFIKTSMEDVRFNVFWRDAFLVNANAESTWARFLVIPYLKASGSISPVKKDIYERDFFAAPFGNNRHASAGLTAGVNLDFLETIEIGGEMSFTHFFKKKYCNMPVPNSPFQTNIYPYSTDVSIQPGENWYFCARIAAYHFLDRLSMHFEWYVLDHQKDHIDLITPDPNNVFLPGVLECRSSFKVKLGNFAFNYDLSPNFNLGFLWQIPFSQRNAYRSSTIMAGLNVTF
jgi:hypothetical protein